MASSDAGPGGAPREQPGVPASVLRSWDEAEARLFPLVTAQPELHQQALGAVQQLLGRLRETRRLAVLGSYRYLGPGAPLVRFAVSAAARRGGREMEAFIQPANVAFFRWLGWRRTGDLVDYAGIPHQRMLIDLTGR